MAKHKHAKKKVYLSNVDVPVSNTNAKVVKSNNAVQCAPCRPSQPPKSILKTSAPKQPAATEEQPSTSAESKFVLPELFSTLAVSKKIERVKNTQAAPITSSRQLTPKSKKQLNTKITKQLNHQPDTNVYSGLGPVEVQDNQRLPAKRRAIYQFTGKKDPEPVLSDFATPLKPFIGKLDLQTQTHKMKKEPKDNFSNILYVMVILDGMS